MYDDVRTVHYDAFIFDRAATQFFNEVVPLIWHIYERQNVCRGSNGVGSSGTRILGRRCIASTTTETAAFVPPLIMST